MTCFARPPCSPQVFRVARVCRESDVLSQPRRRPERAAVQSLIVIAVVVGNSETGSLTQCLSSNVSYRTDRLSNKTDDN